MCMNAKSLQSCLTLCDAMDHSLPGPPLKDLPNSGVEPRSPTLQADSFPSELPGKFPRRLLNNSNVINKNFEV